MSKSLVYFLLLVSVTSAYAESAVPDNTATTPHVNASDHSSESHSSFVAASKQLVEINPISIGQNLTPAEQLQVMAFDAITINSNSNKFYSSPQPKQTASTPKTNQPGVAKQITKESADQFVNHVQTAMGALKHALVSMNAPHQASVIKTSSKESNQHLAQTTPPIKITFADNTTTHNARVNFFEQLESQSNSHALTGKVLASFVTEHEAAKMVAPSIDTKQLALQTTFAHVEESLPQQTVVANLSQSLSATREKNTVTTAYQPKPIVIKTVTSTMTLPAPGSLAATKPILSPVHSIPPIVASTRQSVAMIKTEWQSAEVMTVMQRPAAKALTVNSATNQIEIATARSSALTTTTAPAKLIVATTTLIPSPAHSIAPIVAATRQSIAMIKTELPPAAAMTAVQTPAAKALAVNPATNQIEIAAARSHVLTTTAPAQPVTTASPTNTMIVTASLAAKLISAPPHPIAPIVAATRQSIAMIKTELLPVTAMTAMQTPAAKALAVNPATNQIEIAAARNHALTTTAPAQPVTTASPTNTMIVTASLAAKLISPPPHPIAPIVAATRQSIAMIKTELQPAAAITAVQTPAAKALVVNPTTNQIEIAAARSHVLTTTAPAQPVTTASSTNTMIATASLAAKLISPSPHPIAPIVAATRQSVAMIKTEFLPAAAMTAVQTPAAKALAVNPTTNQIEIAAARSHVLTTTAPAQPVTTASSTNTMIATASLAAKLISPSPHPIAPIVAATRQSVAMIKTEFLPGAAMTAVQTPAAKALAVNPTTNQIEIAAARSTTLTTTVTPVQTVAVIPAKTIVASTTVSTLTPIVAATHQSVAIVDTALHALQPMHTLAKQQTPATKALAVNPVTNQIEIAAAKSSAFTNPALPIVATTDAVVKIVARPQIAIAAKKFITPIISSTPSSIAIAESALHSLQPITTAVTKPTPAEQALAVNPLTTTIEIANARSSLLTTQEVVSVPTSVKPFVFASTAIKAVPLATTVKTSPVTSVPSSSAIVVTQAIGNISQPITAAIDTSKALYHVAKIAGVATTNLALDKTLLQQISVAKTTPTTIFTKPELASAMLAENEQPTTIALPQDSQEKSASHAAGLLGLPVIPVGRAAAEKAEEVQEEQRTPAVLPPAPGSLGTHAIPVAAMVATPSVPAKIVATPRNPITLASNEHFVSTTVDMLSKAKIDKVFQDSSATEEPIVFTKATTALLARSMVAMATPTLYAIAGTVSAPSAVDLTDPISQANIWSVLKSKKNNFNTAMIEKETGLKGVYFPSDKTYKISVPRTDLTIIVNGVKLTSAMGLTSWVTFKNNNEDTALQGNLALTEEQVNSVMFVAIENNLNVTELHNHYLWESPKMVFMHIQAEGNTKQLATAVGKVFAKMLETGQGNGEFPIAQIDTANTTLQPATIEKILRAKGALVDGVYQIHVVRADKGTKVLSPDPTKGANATATFAGSDDEAVLDGDIAMQSAVLQKVLFALHQAGISVVALHERTINDRTRFVFLHYWGVGKTKDLAKGLMAAMDASVQSS